MTTELPCVNITRDSIHFAFDRFVFENGRITAVHLRAFDGNKQVQCKLMVTYAFLKNVKGAKRHMQELAIKPLRHIAQQRPCVIVEDDDAQT